MKYEMAGPACPLCKDHLGAGSAEFTVGTRLCEPCQALVQTAFRGPGFPAVSSPVVAQSSTTVSQGGQDARALDYELAGSSALSESFAAAGLSLGHEVEPPSPPETHDGFGFHFFDDQDQSPRLHITDPDSSSIVAENGASRGSEEVSRGLTQTALVERQPAHEYVEADYAHRASETAFTVVTPDTEATEERVPENPREEAQLIGEQSATDPWEAPLPAWDCSQNEWPLLVGPTQPKLLTKNRGVLAAVITLLVVALLVVAAGYYFLVYRASTPPRRTAAQSGETERVAAVAEPHASTVATEGQVDPPREAAASTPAKPVEPAAQDAALSNEIKNAQGRFSLQAAAFPTQSGADEFADKLKRAGLPSYVASVELARRGRWFRVRIGRFNAADDAQKFAGEAQQRARAAGLSLQLIVCQYDQP